jgi:hypothetical protein
MGQFIFRQSACGSRNIHTRPNWREDKAHGPLLFII